MNYTNLTIELDVYAEDSAEKLFNELMDNILSEIEWRQDGIISYESDFVKNFQTRLDYDDIEVYDEDGDSYIYSESILCPDEIELYNVLCDLNVMINRIKDEYKENTL